MTTLTYGDHAEGAAAALNALIGLDCLPAGEDAVAQALHCRDAVIDALRQRLYDLGQDDFYPPPGHLPARVPAPALAGLDEKLASLVDQIAFALPTTTFDERPPPTEFLAEQSADPATEWWRRAAVESLAASHVLSMAIEQPWRSEVGAAWWVMRDLSVLLEAVVVLDERLGEVGLLSGPRSHEPPMGMAQRRMVLSQTTRLATWYATSAIADEAATDNAPGQGANVASPVHLIGTATDLAPAQRLLARYLRPLSPNDAFYDGVPEISAASARQITASQLYLCRYFATAASSADTSADTNSTATKPFVTFFADRADVLDVLQRQIAYLVDVEDREPNRRRSWQQGELTTAVIRMQSHNARLNLPPTQLPELARATHEVTHNLGRALRREARRTTSNLRDANPTRRRGPVTIARRSPLEVTLTNLIHAPAPAEPAARISDPLQRAALRATLDLTPPTPSPPNTPGALPSPYPAARRTSYMIPTR